MRKNRVITIDGPAGAGKSSIAKELAKSLGYLCLDTGAIYRTITLWCVRNPNENPVDAGEHIALRVAEREQHMLVDGVDVGDEIRTKEISEKTPEIAKIPDVRKVIHDILRNVAAGHDIVIEGRETGSVIFPNADVKFYLDADVETRARRRMNQSPGQFDTLEEAVAAVRGRDRADETRETDPLVRTEDMFYIDSTEMTPLATVALILRECHKNGVA